MIYRRESSYPSLLRQLTYRGFKVRRIAAYPVSPLHFFGPQWIHRLGVSARGCLLADLGDSPSTMAGGKWAADGYPTRDSWSHEPVYVMCSHSTNYNLAPDC